MVDIPARAKTMPSILRQNWHVGTLTRARGKCELWLGVHRDSHFSRLPTSILTPTFKTTQRFTSSRKSSSTPEIQEANIFILTESENRRKGRKSLAQDIQRVNRKVNKTLRLSPRLQINLTVLFLTGKSPAVLAHQAGQCLQQQQQHKDSHSQVQDGANTQSPQDPQILHSLNTGTKLGCHTSLKKTEWDKSWYGLHLKNIILLNDNSGTHL